MSNSAHRIEADPGAWDIVRRSRAAERPSASWYIASSFERFRELHGDRRYRDDPSIVGGFAWLGRRRVVVIAHESGRTDRACERRNYGMPFPEGYHKARRLMRLADHFGRPIVTLVDTPGAYPGLGAEARGQSGAIAALLREMGALTVPTVAVIIGQGGSGGALALAFADRVLILENATYSVISPEGCASILWRRSDEAPAAAAALGLTPRTLAALGIVDEVIPEPAGGIADDPAGTARAVRRSILRHLRELTAMSATERGRRRDARYTALGHFDEGTEPALHGRR